MVYDWFRCQFFFFSSRRRHTRFDCDWSSDVCSSDLAWGPKDSVHARAVSTRNTIVSDSLALDLPDEVLTEARALANPNRPPPKRPRNGAPRPPAAPNGSRGNRPPPRGPQSPAPPGGPGTSRNR